MYLGGLPGRPEALRQLIARYAGRRTVASGRLLENPLVLATLGELAARIDAVEALKDQVAERLDAGRPVPPEVPMAAKVIGSDSLNWAAGQLMQLLGGRGYMENNLAPQILRDARLYSVGEGPNEALTTQVGRKARLTDAIDGYLRACPAGADPADVLAASVREIADRCVNRPGPFADRSSAQLWADALHRPGRLRHAAPGRSSRGPPPWRLGKSSLRRRLGRGPAGAKPRKRPYRQPGRTAHADSFRRRPCRRGLCRLDRRRRTGLGR